MSRKGSSSSGILTTMIKIVIFVFALYLAYLILRPLLSIFLGIGFWVIRVMIFIAVAFIVIHLFLKIIFQIDLFQSIFGRNGRR